MDAAIDAGRLALKPKGMLLDDVRVKAHAGDALGSYSLFWLRAGADAILGPDATARAVAAAARSSSAARRCRSTPSG